MDKKELAILISNLSDTDLIEIYKNKRIDNFGFRVNRITNIHKNRNILEQNLLKSKNIKYVHGFFLFKANKSKIKIDNLSDDEVQKLIETEEKIDILSALYATGDKEKLKKLIDKNFEINNENVPEIKNEENNKEDRTDNKYEKTIKKLERKLTNIIKDYHEKESNYKLKLENNSQLISDLKKENIRKTQDYGSLKEEKDKLTQEIERLKNQNSILISTVDELNEQNKILKLQIQEKERSSVNSSIMRNQLENEVKKSVQDSSNDLADDNLTFEVESYQIAVLGESNDLILNDNDAICFNFFEGKEVNKFMKDNKFYKYDEIWIIHYNLTQKERRHVHSSKFKSIKDIKIQIINSLRELNQTIDNAKKRMN